MLNYLSRLSNIITLTLSSRGKISRKQECFFFLINTIMSVKNNDYQTHYNTNKHTPTNIQHKTSIKQTNIPKTEIDICTDWVCIISQSLTDICTDRICIISQWLSLITAHKIYKINLRVCIYILNENVLFHNLLIIINIRRRLHEVQSFVWTENQSLAKFNLYCTSDLDCVKKKPVIKILQELNTQYNIWTWLYHAGLLYMKCK